MKLSNAIEKILVIRFYNGQIRWFDLTKEYNKLTSSKEKDFLKAFMKDP